MFLAGKVWSEKADARLGFRIMDMKKQLKGSSCGIWTCAGALFYALEDWAAMLNFQENNVDDFRVYMLMNLGQWSRCRVTGARFQMYDHKLISVYESEHEKVCFCFCQMLLVFNYIFKRWNVLLTVSSLSAYLAMEIACCTHFATVWAEAMVLHSGKNC